MGRWTVITELPLHSLIRARGREAERDLLALQNRLRAEGPDAFGLDSAQFGGAAAWDRIDAACRPDLFVEVGGRRLWVELEIRPGRTIVCRRGRLDEPRRQG
jgi:hypothetical protein